MKYITHRRFKDMGIGGSFNLPAMTECECQNGILYHNETPICYITSENAHQYFALHEDGLGIERGKLTRAIQKALAVRDENYQKRWDRVWEDSVCQNYKRDTYEDYWLWNHDFFNADILTLRHIATLVEAKEE